MAQANLKHLVEDAELRVQRSLRYLDRQREAVSSLEQTNQDATIAKRLLTISEKAFEIHVADRARLTKGSLGWTATDGASPEGQLPQRQQLPAMLPLMQQRGKVRGATN